VEDSSSVGLRSALALLRAVTPAEFPRFRASIDEAWIEEALVATGTATVRLRRLPAEQVIWLVLGMALMRDRPILDIVDKLDLALPSRNGKPIVPAAVAQARARLGDEPMQWLFMRTGETWAHQSARRHAWRGLALYGVDGSTVRVPDSPSNRQWFGGQSGRNASTSGYPLVRMAVLMALRSHLLANASFGPYTSEHEYAAELWSSVPDDSLVIVDRGFLAAGILVPLASRGSKRHWLTRAKSTTKWRVIEHLGDGDDLVELTVSSQARAKDPTLPSTYRARAIRYERRGFRPQTLLTSLVDAKAYPRDEIVVLYHERWELELGYDELKTEMLDREEAIRSRTPVGVAQELWGLLLAYNLIRLEMERIADEAGVAPTRISFVAALRFIRDEWFWLEGTRTPGAIPRHLADLRRNILRFILPERRPRSYPRAVKLKMSNYKRKRPATEQSAK
jgi:transposase IS4-like protein/DDE family transposase